MILVIEAKFLQLTPRRDQLSLTYEFDQETQSERQQLRIWREVDRCTIVFKNAAADGNYRFYTFHEDFNDDYSSGIFWFSTWPVIAGGLNEVLADSDEGIAFEVQPIEFPSWAVGDATAIPLPANAFDNLDL
jgi:hypothetical protein